MPKSVRFPFTEVVPSLGAASLLPILPLTLINDDRRVEASGLLDTGSTVNVMPYDVGLQLGARWDEQTASISLTGNLAQLEARALIVSVRVADFDAVRLAFAWTQSNDVPLLLGQVNFFNGVQRLFFALANFL